MTELEKAQTDYALLSDDYKQLSITLDAQRETIRQKDELIRDLVEAATLTLSRLQANGDWDDGCFYYNGTSASELQLPIEKLQSALKKRKE